MASAAVRPLAKKAKAIPIHMPGSTTQRDIKKLIRYPKAVKLRRLEILERRTKVFARSNIHRVAPLPMTKTPKKFFDPEKMKKLHVHPQTVEITNADRNDVTPENLPVIKQKIARMREWGFSWDVIESTVHRDFVDHLDSKVKPLKRAMVTYHVAFMKKEEEAGRLPPPPSEPVPRLNLPDFSKAKAAIEAQLAQIQLTAASMSASSQKPPHNDIDDKDEGGNNAPKAH